MPYAQKQAPDLRAFFTDESGATTGPPLLSAHSFLEKCKFLGLVAGLLALEDGDCVEVGEQQACTVQA
jgi:hypothetical protein